MAVPARSISTVLVTGASRGLGYNLCRLLLRSGGFHVIATAREFDVLQRSELRKVLETTQGTAGKRPTKLSTLEGVDVSSAACRALLPEQVVKELDYSKLDVLVNNAGVFPSGWSSAALESALLTNTAAPLSLTESLLPLLSADAHVISVSSGLGKRSGLSSAYSSLIEGCKR